MNRFAIAQPANCNSDSELPTVRMPECPAPEVHLPKQDERITTLDVVESDLMTRDNYVALVLHTESTYQNRCRDRRANRDTAAGSGVRRKRSR